MTSARCVVVSPYDASLSTPRTCHLAPGNAPAAPHAADAHDASVDTERQRDGPTLGADLPSTERKTAARDRIAHKAEPAENSARS